MPNLELELYDGVTLDTLTLEVTQKAVYIHSGARRIYIGINTLVKIADFLREKGIQI